MKILVDQGTPAPLGEFLVGHSVEPAYERGWSTLSNGELLAAAEALLFDLLITTDQSLRSQQGTELVGQSELEGHEVCAGLLAPFAEAPGQ